MSTKTRLEKIFQRAFKDPNIRIKPTDTALSYPGWTPEANDEVMNSVEKEFKVKITEDEMGDLKSMNDFVKLIDDKCKK